MKRDYVRWLEKFSEEHSEEKERMWKASQLFLLEQLCEELDSELEELVTSSRWGAVGSKAVLTVYISTLRQEYRYKKKLLEDSKKSKRGI